MIVIVSISVKIAQKSIWSNNNSKTVCDTSALNELYNIFMRSWCWLVNVYLILDSSSTSIIPDYGYILKVRMNTRQPNWFILNISISFSILFDWWRFIRWISQTSYRFWETSLILGLATTFDVKLRAFFCHFQRCCSKNQYS